MAVNIIYDKIFAGLKIVLGRHTVVEDDLAPKSSEYIRLSKEAEPELLENAGGSFSMLYSVNIDLITNQAKRAKYITQAMSNIVRLLNDNPAKTTDGVYYWHDGQMLSSDPGPAFDEEDKQMYAGRILWQATHTEIK